MKKDVYVIFNTCGISQREKIDLYISAIQSLIEQEDVNFRVILSSCFNSAFARTRLFSYFGKNISYNFIDELYPVNITFNKTVRESVKRFGEATAYLYIDSGIQLNDNKNVLSKLISLHTSGPYGMTAGRVDSDSGTYLWFREGISQQDETGQSNLFKNGHFIIPIGKTINLHLQLFDNSIYQAFDKRILPDIFASHCTESVFSFITSSINKKFIIHKDILVQHITSMDGASSGFRPEFAGKPGWQHILPIARKTIFDIINNQEALDCGFGYEECQNVLNHNPLKYDEHGNCLDPERLKKFLNNNLYINPEYLDYDKITSNFIE